MNARATIGNLRCWLCAIVGAGAVMGASEAFAGKPYGVLASYKPDNVHRGTPRLAPYLRRVAVLPLACASDTVSLEAGRDALQPVLESELIRTKNFEVVKVSPERLRGRTGRTSWTGAEALPAAFFESMRAETDCDAVLFCQLTLFRGYAPLAIGWRMRLVDVHTRQTLWAVDEVFDATEPAVVRGARRFDQEPGDGWAILNSPRRFGTYAVSAVLATLPTPSQKIGSSDIKTNR